MNGRVAKKLRKEAGGNRIIYRSLKKAYKSLSKDKKQNLIHN